MKRSPVGHIKSFNYVVFIDMDISVHRLPVPGLWIPGYNIILKIKHLFLCNSFRSTSSNDNLD